ncbi:RibD family protein, partial [Kribbia dieselivorans]|uniref:RibD family protein n=1 Tax=Kribbia dieselivorans TaxID=331526 RepID=UPI00157A2EE3
IDAVLTALYARDIRAVLLEGGATTAGSFVAAGAIDRVVGYLAPALLGDGPAVLAGGGITTISDALRLRIDDIAFVGADIRVTAVPRVDADPIDSHPSNTPGGI